MKINNIIKKYPYAKDFFDKYNLEVNENTDLIIKDFLNNLSQDEIEHSGIDKENFEQELNEYIELMEMYALDQSSQVESLKIVSGYNKFNEKENFDILEIKKGEIISIVGPTGAGKSRLLADIEWASNEDTPTKRKILVNDKVLETKERFSVSNKLVAQLSQNMNFVMDLSVKEFLELHASSRMVDNIDEVVIKIFEKATNLAGEKFELTTPITSLSGGQSRALMISDTAFLSNSPIILIDEIENAGINRKEALDLLVTNDKIVFISTHDPILALMADKRIVINNGGIIDIIKTSSEEKDLLKDLEKLDNVLLQYRTELRYGKKLTKKEI